MRGDLNTVKEPQKWIADRWIKHSDSASITEAFSNRSSWNQLRLPDGGLNVVAMQSLAAAFANEGNPQWLDSTRLAWRTAVSECCHRSLVHICLSLCQLGNDPLMTPNYNRFRHRNYQLALALCKATRWAVGEHLVNATWAKVLRNRGDIEGFLGIASGLNQPRVLRAVLSSEATPVQRFQVVQTLSLHELERQGGATRLDWILGLLSELGGDLEAGSTAMRVLLVESELAVRQDDFNVAFVSALQLTNHMVSGNSELCSRADLANLLRNISSAFGHYGYDDDLAASACESLLPKLEVSGSQLDSLARDMDRLADDLPQGLRVALPRLAGHASLETKSARGVVLPFKPRNR
ncbi:MAG: hypothetical protein ACPGSC_10260 [Granulosicoccaceae bacterium]